MGSVICGTGMFVPDNVVTNDDLSRIMDTSDHWITSRTGVKERRFADPGTGSSDLAVEAGRRAITDAGIEPGDVLYHDQRETGRVGPGKLVCCAAFGAGAHYRADLYREPPGPGA